MKIFYIFILNVFALSFVASAQTIPAKEADFKNSANFPTVAGDAMFPSRTNYYRADGYAYTKKADGSLYLTEGGWGATQVDSSGNLVKFLYRYNHPTNGSYYLNSTMKPWDMTDAANQFQDGFFRLYSNLKLTPTNPTPSSISSDLKTLRRATSNETFPYFNSYAPINGDTIYNWQSWMYPIASGKRYVDPKTANDQRDAQLNPGTAVYRDYNYVTLRDADPSNDLAPNAGDRNFELDLSASQTAPTNIYARINNNRDKMILTIWYGHRPLAGTASKPLADLRITGWDNAYDMKYKLWFNGIAAVTPGNLSSNPEYNKIYLANNIAQGINNENGGQGSDIRAFNQKFDNISESAEDVLSASTEAAMEMNGLRNIAYDNDIDAYGETVKKLNLKFRMLTVGMEFDANKIQQRVFNNAGFSFSEMYFNPTTSGYNAFRDTFNFRKLNFFHPQHPFGLTPEHYIDIVTTRPAIAFDAVNAGVSAYEGSLIEMSQGQSNAISVISLNITENASSQLPFTELDASPSLAQIDSTRVRVSLVTKAGYDATNTAINNDVPTVAGFSYLTQADFVALQNTISVGNYMIKYDYSSPDSKGTIKTEGATLGEVFAKSIYRPLNVNAITPVKVSAFNLKANNNSTVTLEWKTSFEDNTAGFEIERSNNNAQFFTISTIKAKNLSAGSSYQFTDNAPLNGENFYRLKSIDLNNNISLFEVKSIIINDVASQIKLYPNPAKSVINIVSKEAQPYFIYDTNGRLVLNGTTNRNTITQINIAHLAAGIYFIKTNGATTKFVVTH